MHSQWQFFIAQSSDFDNVVAEITYESKEKQFQLALNRPGSYSFSLPLNTDWKDYLTPVKYCILAQRDHEIVWSGPIWTKNEGFGSQRISIGCVGWQEILHKRFHDGNQTVYNADNAGDIAFDILAKANAQHDTWISEGANTNTQTRTVTLEPLQNYGDQILALTEIENGFDFTIDPVTREMDIFASNDFVETEIVLGYNIGPYNLDDFARSTDADQQANQWYVQGQFITAEAHDDTSIADTEQLLQQVVSLTDVADSTLLGAIVNAELEVNKYPRVLIQPSPKTESDNPTIPKFFKDYTIGNQVTVVAERDGASQEEVSARIFGATLDINDNGMEKLSSMQVTYQGG